MSADYYNCTKQKRIERENRRRKQQKRHQSRYRESVVLSLLGCLMWVSYLYIGVAPSDVLSLFLSSSPSPVTISIASVAGALGVVLFGASVLYEALCAHEARQSFRRSQGVPLIDAREQDAEELVDR